MLNVLLKTPVVQYLNVSLDAGFDPFPFELFLGMICAVKVS